MKVECTTCKTKYVIADEKVPAGGARVRCRKCQNVFQVPPPALEPAPTELETIPEAPPLGAAPPVPAPVAPPRVAPPAPEPVREPAPAHVPPAPEPGPELVPFHAMPPTEEIPAMAGIERSAYPGLPTEPPAPLVSEPPAPLVVDPPAPRMAPPPTRPVPASAHDAPRQAHAAPPPAPTHIPPPAPAAPAAQAAPPPQPSASGQASSGIPAGLSAEERTKHERARRLARVLASDIAIYNKEKRDRGVKDGNLVAVLGYEIKKSWEIYKERVTPELANSTPYFRDALNEIVAEGKRVF